MVAEPKEAQESEASRQRTWPMLSPYVETIVLIALLAYARWAAAGVLEDRARYTLFFIAPCYAVWRGGLVLGLLALATTGYIGTFFFLPPDRRVAIEETGDLLGLILYLGVGLSIVLLGEAQRAEKRRVLERDRELVEAHARLAEANEALEKAVQSRTAQLEELRNWAADEFS
jgi:K+-sensing histidine kinase KdpD